MSSIDERIVQMKFDNNQFESGVKTTLESLDNLKKGLNFSGLESGISALQRRFSTMGIVGMEITRKLTDAALDAGKRIGNATIGQIKSGGMTRALNIEQARFQLKGLGLDVEEVMRNAGDAVENTAYGLDAAAKAASVLGASGIKAGKQMTSVLTTIAGAAAMTGRDYSDIADIFSTVASNGRLMTEQLRQFSHSGLNVTAVLQKKFHKTGEEIEEMVKKGEISFDMFNDAMSKFGEHAKDANNTYQGALSNMKAALSRIGQMFATGYGMGKNGKDMKGYIENMRDIFNAMIPLINNAKAALKPFAHDVLKLMTILSGGAIKLIKVLTGSVKKGIGPITNLVNGLTSFARSFYAILYPLKDAFKDIFPEASFKSLRRATKDFKMFAGMISGRIHGNIHNFRDAWAGLFTIIKSVGKVLGFVIDLIKAATAPFGGFINIVSTIVGTIGRLIQTFYDFASGSEFITNAASKIVEFVGKAAQAIHDLFINSKTIQTLPVFLSLIVQHFTLLKDRVKDLLSAFKDSKAFTLIETTIQRIKDLIISIFDIDLVKVFGDILTFGDKAKEFFNNFKDTKFAGTLINAFDKLKSVVSSVLSPLLDFMISLISLDFSTVIDKISSLGGKIKEFISNIKNTTDFKLISAGFGKLLDVINSVLNLDFGSALSTIGGGLFSFVELLGKGIKNLVKFIGSLNLGDILSKTLNTALAGGVTSAIILVADYLRNIRKRIGEQEIESVRLSIINLTNELKVLTAGLKKSVDANVLKTQATAILLFSTALIVFSLAVRTLSSIDASELIRGLTGVIILMGTMSKSLKTLESAALGKASIKKLIGISAALLVFSWAVKSLSKTISRLAQLDWAGMIKGLIGLGAILLGLNLFMKKTKFDSISLEKAAGIFLIAEALKVMSKAVKKFGSLKVPELLKGLIGVSTILFAISTFLNSTSFKADPKAMLATGAGLIMISLALKMFAKTVSKMGQMNFEEMTVGLAGLASILGILALAVNYMSSDKMAAIGGGLLLMSVGITIIAAALKILSSIGGIEQMATALLGIIAPLTMLGLVAEYASPAKMAATAAGLLIFAVAITVLTPALIAFSKLSIEGILKSMVMLAGILLTLGIAATALTPVIPMIAALGVAILIFGAGVTVTAAGLMLLSMAFTSLAVSAAAGAAALIAAITAILTGVITMVPEIGASLAEAFMSFIATLAEGAAKVTDAAVKLGMALLRGIQQIVPQLVSTGISLMMALLRGIEANIEAFAYIGINIIARLLLGIARGIGTIIQAGIALMFAFVNGLAQGIRDNTEAVVAAAKNMMSAVVEAILTILEGLLGSIPVIGDKIEAGLESAKEHVRDFFDVDEAEKMSSDYINSVSKGIDDGVEKLKQSGGSAGEAATKPTIEGFNKLGDASSNGIAKVSENLDAGKGDVGTAAVGVSDEILGPMRESLEEAGYTGAEIDNMMGKGMTDNLGAVQTGAEKMTGAANKEYDKATKSASKKAKEQTTAYAKALDPKTAANAAKSISERVAKNLDAGKKSALSSGKTMVKEYTGAIKKGESEAKTASTLVAKSAGNGTNSPEAKTTATNAGRNLGEGFIQGIRAKDHEAYMAGYNQGKQAAKGQKDGAKEKSPSKIAIQTGKYLGEGLVIGINSMNKSAYNAGYNIGNTAASALSSAMTKVHDILNSDLDMSPKITPVLDLSNIHSGMNQLNGMLDTRTMSASISGNMGGLRLMSAYPASNSNSVANSTSNVFNITVDGTENPEAFADRLVRQFQLRGRMA